MSVATMFTNFLAGSPAAAPANAQQAAPTPGNIPADAASRLQATANAATAPNGVIPADMNTQIQKPESILDNFKDIWNTPTNNSAAPAPLFNISQDKLMEAARKQNFKPQLSQEQMAAINAGGPEAMQAMLEVVNTMTQDVYAQSAFAATQLISGALDKSGFAKRADVDSAVKNNLVSDSLRTANPIFSNPVTAPLMEGLKQQILLKNPNASPTELTQLAQEYLQGFMQLAGSPQQQQQQQAAASKGEDWDKFFGAGSMFG